MPRVSVYLNKEVYDKARSRAKEKGTSLSGYISNVLTERINGWPEGYFELIGSLYDDADPIKLPEKLPWELNAPRGWPDEFFESLGTIDDETFDVPKELPWELDVPRGRLNASSDEEKQ